MFNGAWFNINFRYSKWLLPVVVLSFFLLGFSIAVFKPWQGGLLTADIIYQNENIPVSEKAQPVHWQDLLGVDDKVLLQSLRDKKVELSQRFQQHSKWQMESQLLSSALTAQTWQSLDGYQINEALAGKRIRLPGFLVPLDVMAAEVKSFFIVPYYGACLHYPPPPPNQIVYVRLPDYIPLLPLQQALQFSGVLQPQLFEDPLGTAVWAMEVMEIKRYSETTDDARIH